MPFEVATSPLLAKAILDDKRRQNRFSKQVLDVVSQVFGTRFVNEKEHLLQLASALTMYGSMALGGMRSLGEEYVDILPITVKSAQPRSSQSTSTVTRQLLLRSDDGNLRSVLVRTAPSNFHSDRTTSTDVRPEQHIVPSIIAAPVGKLRYLIFSLLISVEDLVLQIIIKRLLACLSPSYDSSSRASTLAAISATRRVKEITERVKTVHMMLFFIFGIYASLPHRVVGMRYLSLTPRFQARMKKHNVYISVGIMMCIQHCYYLYVWMQEWRRSARGDMLNTQQIQPIDDRAGAVDEMEGNGRCILCYGDRRVPTAAICGHIFCWRCIADWIQTQPFCPLCRHSCTHNTLVPLVGYEKSSP